ncbi:MAG: VCBS repeat-containing protein [Desulfuromonadales bacterium]|nr:VCBS repeat-containing protein [Desulfuromonadales bacterium]
MKIITSTITILLVAFCSLPALAASPLRVFVGDMNAVGVQNRDELKTTLQTLLASRLNSDSITAVSSATEADAILTGTYVVIGKIFSVDAMAKSVGGKTLTRAFVQGESQDELIPAMGKLADKLTADLTKLYTSGQITSVAPVYSNTPATVVRPVITTKSDIIKSEPVHAARTEEFIKPKDVEQTPASGWQSKRLAGAANLIATGKTLADGSREVFLAEARRLSYYHQSDAMKLVAETEFKNIEKILSLDVMEGSDGQQDIYLTIIHGEELSSQVWQVKGGKLVRVAEDLPYYFRSFSLAGAPRKLYAQAVGRDADFYGDVAEAHRNGSKITLTNPIKMPRFGNIFGFNQFTDGDGKIYTVVINPDGYLVVYDTELKELWRSNDKFGGSELYFQKEDLVNVRVTNDKFRWIFMDQRIQVTSKGDVLVGKNDGFWVIGNARSYKKGAVYCFSWNGSSLDEKWHTRETQNYMPDYYFDEARNELLILQTVQRPGITTRGAASLAIKKVE